MKTKKFLLATAGATVDGRSIDEKMLTEMAEGYDPKTYGARLNIEHIRGVVPGSDFGAYGDVLELSTGEVEVNMHGKTEKRLGLFGVFDVTEKAKELNEASQKLYPSIEIEPNFAGTGKAYLMGVALTDSPASVATERLKFNRQMPGTLHLKADDAAQAFALEFAEEDGTPTQAGKSLLAQFTSALDAFAAKFAAKPDDQADAPKNDDKGPASLDFAQLRPLFDQLGDTFAAEVARLQARMDDQADQFTLRFKAIEDKFEATPPSTYTARPIAAGANGDATVTDC